MTFYGLRIVHHGLQFLGIQIVLHFECLEFLSCRYGVFFDFRKLLWEVLIGKTLRLLLQIVIVLVYVVQCLFYYSVVNLAFYVEFHLLQKCLNFIIENFLKEFLIVLQSYEICVFRLDLFFQYTSVWVLVDSS